MTLIIKKDGHLITDEANPIAVKALENLLMLLADPSDGDTIVYNAEAGMWLPGNPLPVAITEPADGDTLVYDETTGKWVNQHAEA